MLVTALARRTGKPFSVMLEDFGHAYFGKWVTCVADSFENKSLFDILEGIDHFHEHGARNLREDQGNVRSIV